MIEINMESIMSSKMNLCGHLSWATLHVVANIYHINKDSIACCCAYWMNENVITKKKLQCKMKKEIRKKQEQKNKTLMRSCWPPISNLSSVWLKTFSWWCLKRLTTETAMLALNKEVKW